MPPSMYLRTANCTVTGVRDSTHLCLSQLVLGAVVESYEEQYILVKYLALLYRSIGRGVADYTETKLSPFMKLGLRVGTMCTLLATGSKLLRSILVSVSGRSPWERGWR